MTAVDETERLNDLIARCEKASGPDTQLDGEIYCAANGLKFRSVDKTGGIHFEPDEHGTHTMVTPHPYTESLDAAMTLVRPNCEWEIGSAHLLGVYWARLISAAEYTAKRAPTPALALVIATLKSRLPHPAKES